MTEWRETTLGAGLAVRHGFAFKGEHFCSEGELIVLSPGNFYDAGGFKPKGGKEKYYGGSFPPEYLLRKGDVVIAMTEQTPGLLGSSATVPSNYTYLHNQRLGLLRITDPNVLDLRYCYHLLNCPMVRDQIEGTATGSKVRHTAPARIQGVRVRLPNQETQRKVADILDAVDDLVERNRGRIELFEQMAQAIYREWFVCFRYPVHEDLAFVDSTLGRMPDGWEVTPIETIVVLDRTSVQPGRSTAEAFDHYSIPAFDDGQLPVVDLGETIKSGKFLITEPAVLVSKLNPRIERTWFVEPRPGRRSVASTEFLVLRPVAGLSLEFLYLLARSATFQERLRELSGGTSTSHQRAKPDDFLRIEVLVPPVPLSERLAAAVGSHCG